MADGIRIATFPLGARGAAPIPVPYEAGAIYPIDDENPWLCIGFPEKKKVLPMGKHKVGRLEPFRDGSPADGLHWWKWQPFATEDKDIGRQRRYGHYRTELYEPCRITLQCYVWPGRFFDPLRYQTMLADIEQELGRAIEWERSEVSIRSRVVSRRGRPTAAELLRTIQDELYAVHALERTGALSESPGAMPELAEAAAPEARLVAMWAWRRLADLVQLRQEQARAAELRGAGASDPNQARAQQSMKRAAAEQADEDEAKRLAAQVGRIADRRRCDLLSFDLSPAMQRDHRLRRLVRAFAPETREHWAAAPTLQMSTSPPLKAPDVFQLWGVARLVRAIRTLGWTLRRREISRATVAPVEEPYLVELSRGELVLTLEHNPTVHQLDCGAVPPMHARRVPLIEWASANVPGPEGLVAPADLRPDYALRLSSAAGEPLALAIGDASLSDPKHVAEPEKGGEGNKTKADKLITYRERIGWRAGGRLIRCLPACTFIVLPGPPSRWEAMTKLVGVDSVLIFPDPGVADDADATARVGAMIETMLAAARPPGSAP